MTLLGGWESFYVIVGSSAGALIGLQFVVISLLAEKPLGRVDEKTSGAFATPNVIHFGAALLLSALISAPWEGVEAVAVLWGILGLVGIAYVVVVRRRMRTQKGYTPVFEDRLFHSLLPLAAYALLVAAALLAFTRERPALFVVAGAALLLLFVGIHNAWDAVTYHVFRRRAARDDGDARR